jgi:hypothetical protein
VWPSFASTAAPPGDGSTGPSTSAERRDPGLLIGIGVALFIVMVMIMLVALGL